MRIRVRLFAIQRELAGAREVPLELADGATVEDAWAAVAARFPVLAPGRPSVRFARNGDYAEPGTTLGDGDEVAFIPPVSGGSDEAGRRRILELHEAPFGPTILSDLEARLATDADGAVVGFVGRTRVSPGTPAPGQEAEAARHAGR
jgi:molybdopterin converting factor subunit 1